MRSLEEIESALDSALSYSVEDVQQMLSTDEKGRVYQSIDNCMIALQNDPVLAGAICHNDLTCKTDIIKNLGWDKPKGGGIRDVDVDQIDWYLERTYGLKNYKAIGKALNIIASQNHFHPVKERLESLEWDGVSRIADVLPKYLGADQCEYTTEVMLLLMQAAIHRIYDPGCKFEIMVCLVGGQGAGKSSFFRLLALDDEWFSDDLSKLGDDNIYRKLQGHWIIEMPEMLATVNAKTVEEIKAFLSRPKDNYKIPYETHPEDRPRQCVFVGTSNTLDFLPLDRTGNRRFAPVMVHPERVKKHILEDEHESREYITQLWAEMMDFYYKHKNYKLKLSKDMEEYLKVMQKEFMPEDTKVGQIQEWLDYCSEDYVCTLMIYREALKHEFDDPKQWELREIGDILNNSIEGWSKGPQHRFEKYGPQRSWKRNEPSGGFIKVPDDTELPFQ